MTEHHIIGLSAVAAGLSTALALITGRAPYLSLTRRPTMAMRADHPDHYWESVSAFAVIALIFGWMIFQ